MFLCRSLCIAILAILLSHCGSVTAPSGGRTEIVNVSAYDPKEKQRSGRGYNEHDVSALRDNGAVALIARVGKGGILDEKCADFLRSADHQGMMPGVYYRTTQGVSMTSQADQMITRAHALAQGRDWSQSHLLLCADFDANSTTTQMIQFLDRVKQRTGVDCVIYLENSEHLRITLHNSNESVKNRLRRCPYWVALYSHDTGACKAFPAPETPTGLTQQYNVWRNWSIWQYGGVAWENRRSLPKVYRGFSPYFGNLDRPVERNLFRGSPAELQQLWSRHGIPLR
ncbi:MAG: hypothetical protein RI957_985 [Verrucomicrobiota bacterium]|jgi:hypothetical protein